VAFIHAAHASRRDIRDPERVEETIMNIRNALRSSMSLCASLLALASLTPSARAWTGGEQEFFWWHDARSSIGWPAHSPDWKYTTVLPSGSPSSGVMHESLGEYVVNTCVHPERITQVQVVAYGPGNVRCKLRKPSHPFSVFTHPGTGSCIDDKGLPIWGLRSYVSCRTPQGASEDSQFVMQVSSALTSQMSGTAMSLQTTDGGRKLAKVWAVATNGSLFQEASVANAYNSSGMSNLPKITRLNTGDYRITVANIASSLGVVQVTAIGDNDVYCKAHGAPVKDPDDANLLVIGVRCFSGNTPKSSDFMLNYDRHATRGGIAHQAAHAVGHLPTRTTSYTPTRSYNTGLYGTTPGTNSIVRTGPGHYFVQHGSLSSSPSAAYVVAAGSGAEYCKIVKWFPEGSKTTVEVQCFDHAGAAKDMQFIETYQGPLFSPI
jgi:hypothetical protein